MSRSYSYATAVLVGPERALTAARTSIGDEALTAALPYVQPAALTPELRDEAHDGGLKVSDFRATTRPRSMSRSHRSPSCDASRSKGSSSSR